MQVFAIFLLVKGSYIPLNKIKTKLQNSRESNDLVCVICSSKNAELPHGTRKTPAYFITEHTIHEIIVDPKTKTRARKHLKCAVAQVLLRHYQTLIRIKNNLANCQLIYNNDKLSYSDSSNSLDYPLFCGISGLAEIACGIFCEAIKEDRPVKGIANDLKFNLFVDYIASSMPELFAVFRSSLTWKLDHLKESVVDFRHRMNLVQILEKASDYALRFVISPSTIHSVLYQNATKCVSDVYFLYLLTKLEVIFECWPLSDIFRFINRRVFFSYNLELIEYEIYKTIFWCFALNKLITETHKISYKIKEVIENTLVKLASLPRLREERNIIESIYKSLYRVLPRDNSNMECYLPLLETVLNIVLAIDDKISQLRPDTTVFSDDVLGKLKEIEEYISTEILKKETIKHTSIFLFYKLKPKNILRYVLKETYKQYFGQNESLGSVLRRFPDSVIRSNALRIKHFCYDNMQLRNILAVLIGMSGSLELLFKRIDELFKLKLMKTVSIRIALRTGLTFALIAESTQLKSINNDLRLFNIPKPKFREGFDVLLRKLNLEHRVIEPKRIFQNIDENTCVNKLSDEECKNIARFGKNNIQSVLLFNSILNEIDGLYN